MSAGMAKTPGEHFKKQFLSTGPLAWHPRPQEYTTDEDWKNCVWCYFEPAYMPISTQPCPLLFALRCAGAGGRGYRLNSYHEEGDQCVPDSGYAGEPEKIVMTQDEHPVKDFLRRGSERASRRAESRSHLTSTDQVSARTPEDLLAPQRCEPKFSSSSWSEISRVSESISKVPLSRERNIGAQLDFLGSRRLDDTT
eukprot:scaffold17410_cov143-Skeletonema_dohrnii-CCMP3373.AAC.1